MHSRLTFGRLVAVAVCIQLGLALGSWLILMAYVGVTSPHDLLWAVDPTLPLVLLYFAVLLPVSLLGAWGLDRVAARSRYVTAIGVAIVTAACLVLGIAAPEGGVALGLILAAEAVAFSAGFLGLRGRQHGQRRVPQDPSPAR